MDCWDMSELTEEEQDLRDKVDARVDKIVFSQLSLFSMN